MESVGIGWNLADWLYGWYGRQDGSVCLLSTTGHTHTCPLSPLLFNVLARAQHCRLYLHVMARVLTSLLALPPRGYGARAHNANAAPSPLNVMALCVHSAASPIHSAASPMLRRACAQPCCRPSSPQGLLHACAHHCCCNSAGAPGGRRPRLERERDVRCDVRAQGAPSARPGVGSNLRCVRLGAWPLCRSVLAIKSARG